MIFVKAGGDCTELFESYHPLSARRVLEKFFVGELAGAGREARRYADDLQDGQFYSVLKERVEKYMKEHKLNPRFAVSMYIKTAIILASLALSYYGAFFYFKGVMASLACAVCMGVAMAEVGVSIQHDANHGAYHKNGFLCHYAGWMLDVVGASSFMWKQQHVVGHHAFTNLHGQDPDIRVSDSDVRRVTKFQPWHSYQKYQHIYLGFLYGLLALKSVLVDDFLALLSGSIGPVKISMLSHREMVEFWAGKALFLTYFIAVPLFASHHSVEFLVILWLSAELVTGWMLAFLFQVAHVTKDVQYIKPNDSGHVNKGWATMQAATTADFCHGSFFWTHISGGLNYQVVHHLFPGICHVHYPKIAPIVLETCKEFGVPYMVYPTFAEALRAHFEHLKEVGSSAALPSLATVG